MVSELARNKLKALEEGNKPFTLSQEEIADNYWCFVKGICPVCASEKVVDDTKWYSFVTSFLKYTFSCKDCGYVVVKEGAVFSEFVR